MKNITVILLPQVVLQKELLKDFEENINFALQMLPYYVVVNLCLPGNLHSGTNYDYKAFRVYNIIL